MSFNSLKIHVNDRSYNSWEVFDANKFTKLQDAEFEKKCLEIVKNFYLNIFQNLCKNCYLKDGRGKKAKCNHTDRPLYALSLCKQCYQTNYSKTRRRKRNPPILLNKNEETVTNSKLCKDFIQFEEQTPKNQQNLNYAEIPKLLLNSISKKNNKTNNFLSKKNFRS